MLILCHFSDKLKEVTEGLKEYFESLLPTHLLYQQERKQHEELISSNPNVKLTRLYSIAHFLRLFGMLLLIDWICTSICRLSLCIDKKFFKITAD